MMSGAGQGLRPQAVQGGASASPQSKVTLLLSLANFADKIAARKFLAALLP
jgi:hypothetical protein